MNGKEFVLTMYINLSEELGGKMATIQQNLGLTYDGNYNDYPHVTLCSCKFDKSKLNKLYKELCLLKARPFKMKLGMVLRADHRGKIFYALKIVDNKSVVDLHKVTLKIVNKLRGDLIMNKDLLGIQNSEYSSQEIKLIQKYGNKRVMENFRPHMSLGLVEEGWAEENRIDERLEKELNKVEDREMAVNGFQISLLEFNGGWLKNWPDEKLVTKEIEF